MNALTEQVMLRTEAPALVALGIQHGWLTRPIWPPMMETIHAANQARREYNKAYAAKWRAANRAKGLTSGGKRRLRRPNGSVPKGSNYMKAVRHGTLPKFKKGKK